MDGTAQATHRSGRSIRQIQGTGNGVLRGGGGEKEMCGDMNLVFTQSSAVAHILLSLGWKTVCQKTTLFPLSEEILPFPLNLSISIFYRKLSKVFLGLNSK